LNDIERCAFIPRGASTYNMVKAGSLQGIAGLIAAACLRWIMSIDVQMISIERAKALNAECLHDA